MLNRKGMSPLIATVLLMAFAVALGGMIMNWSVSQGEEGDCADLKVNVAKLCAQPDKIVLSMRNIGEIPLEGVKLSITEEKVENVVSIKESTLNKGQPLDISIPYSVTGKAKVSVLAVVENKNEPITCSTPLQTIEPIPNC